MWTNRETDKPVTIVSQGFDTTYEVDDEEITVTSHQFNTEHYDKPEEPAKPKKALTDDKTEGRFR